MFERFTDRARQVIVLAQEEARLLKHNSIGTEHLLLGLLREHDGVACRVLESFDVSADAVRDQVGEGEGEAVRAGQIPFTPRAKQVLEFALRESLAFGHNHIGTEHILLGIVREDGGVAARILRDFGAAAGPVRAAVMAMAPGMSRPHRQPPWRRQHRPRRRFSALAMAREEALEAGNHELARKLLELEIEERERPTREPPAATDESASDTA